jgi:hypothetical protein
MSEESTATAEVTEVVETVAETPAEVVEEVAAEPVEEVVEDISYHAVEKEGTVTALWEMQGRKHIRTIDPRSHEGKNILALFETAA